MLRACDTAGVLGWPDCVEYGPGKHALGHSYYVYLLDPDGHRVELLLPPIVYMDREDAPAISDLRQITRVTECWGLPPQNSWFFNRSPFPGWVIANTPDTNNLLSLEKYLHLIA